jgi:hypothetical protein
MGHGVGRQAVRIAGDQLTDNPCLAPFWQLPSGIMVERWSHFLLLLRQRDPGLYAVQTIALRTRALHPLTVRDAAPRDHPIDLLASDRLLVSQTVAVHDFASEQIGHRRQADVRMRTGVDATIDARCEIDRS